MLSQILDFFCNFLNNDDSMEMFAYLGPMDPLNLIGYFVHMGSSGNVTFWHPL